MIGAARRTRTGIARLQGEGPAFGRGRRGAGGGNRTRASSLPKRGTAVIRHRHDGGHGWSRTNVSIASGSQSAVDLRARGGGGGSRTRSVRATARRAKLLHFAPGKYGAPRWICTNVPRLSSACPPIGRGVRGAADGIRTRIDHLGTVAPCSWATALRLRRYAPPLRAQPLHLSCLYGLP